MVHYVPGAIEVNDRSNPALQVSEGVEALTPQQEAKTSNDRGLEVRGQIPDTLDSRVAHSSRLAGASVTH